MSEANSREPDERALDELIVRSLRPADADDTDVNPDQLPPLTDAEREAIASVRPRHLLPSGAEGITTEWRPAPTPAAADDPKAVAARPAMLSRRSSTDARRRWFLAAAIVLIAVGLAAGIPYGTYQYTETQISRLDQQLRQAPERERQRLAEAERAVRGRYVELAVTGPAALQPGAPNVYHLETRDLNRQPVPANFSVRVVDEQQRVVYEQKDVASAGDYRLVLPRSLELKPPTRLALEIVARGQGEGAPLAEAREELALDSPVYVTHLVTDKPMYRPGEVVSFRSLTLDRFSLKPAQEDLRLVFTLKHPDGKEEVLLAGGDRLVDERSATVLGPDRKPVHGVAAGDYPIDPRAPGGEYMLTVRELQNRFPPQKRSFIVNHYQPPRLNKKLEFGRKSYGPGGEVTATCQVTRAEGGAAVAGRPVIATVQVDGKHIKADGQEDAGAALRLQTDPNGVAQIRFKLPAKIERGEASLSVQCTDGGSIETIVRPIPVVVKKLAVKFYPEGGDPVTGIPNRVYFQARTPLGKPADFQGRVVDQDGKVVVADVQTLTDATQPAVNQGMGLFTLTPEPGRRYELKIDSPAGIDGRYPLPEARTDGVVLSVPGGVFRADEPVVVELSNMGRERRLVVGVYCRGRLVDQMPIPLGDNVTQRVRLKAEAAPGGVLRVTVFEDRGDSGLVPLAERLVYRVPSRRLNLAVKPDRSQYLPGDKVHLSVEATNEKGEPAPAVALVAVTDLSVLNLADEKTARSMPTHCYLSTELRRPEDLEQADFLLSDHPQARTALDLLLGTQGWRRFAVQDPEKFRREHTVDAETLLASLGQTPVKTSNRHEIEPAYEEHLKREQQTVRAQAASEQKELGSERRTAMQRLTWIEDLGRAVAILGAVVLALVLVVGPIVGVAILIHRSVGTGTAQTKAVGMLVLCMMCFIVCSGLAIISLKTQSKSTFSYDAPMGLDAREKERQAAGAAVQAPVGPATAPRLDGGNVRIKPQPGAPEAPAMPEIPGMPGMPPPDAQPRLENDELVKSDPEVKEAAAGGVQSLNRHYKEALQARGQRAAVPPQALQTAGFRGFRRPARLVDSGPPIVVREYAHQHEPGPAEARSDFAETVYWHPVLVLPDGKAEVSFDLSESLTTFQVTAYAHSLDGRLGATTATLESRLPFSIEPKLPLEVTAGDVIDVPVTVANDTDAARSVTLAIDVHGLTVADGQNKRQLHLGPNERTRQVFRLVPNIADGVARVRIEGRSQPFAADVVERSFRVVPSGFPVVGAVSDQLARSVQREVPLPETWSRGSLRCQVQVYPSLLADVQTGLEGMLAEPFG